MIVEAGLVGRSDRWPLVGRDEEAGWLHERMACGDSCVLAGPAGVGKTHLVRLVLAELKQAGWHVHWAWATASAKLVPFAPFASLEGDAPTDPAARLEYIVGHLAEQAAQGRVVLAVDDAHLLDGASAALIERLVRDRALPVVATIRQGEPAPDAVVGLWNKGAAQRLELDLLGKPAVDELVRRVLDGPVASELVDKLWRLTGGNALHLREVLVASLESGGLEPVDGCWQDQKLVAAGPRLQEYVSSRIGNLPDPISEGLAAATLAEGLALGILEAAVGHSVMSELRERGLVDSPGRRGQDVVQVTHPLYGETVRAQLSSERQQLVAQALITALKARGPIRGEDLLRAAEIRLAVDDLSDRDLLLAAGQHATSSGYGPLGERLGRAALQAGGGIEARLVLATAIRHQGRAGDAAQVLAEGVDQAETEQERARLAIYWSVSLQQLGESVSALQVLSDARVAVRDPALRVDLDAQRSLVLMFLGRMEESVDLADRLPSHEDLPLQVRLHVEAAKSAMAFRGRADQSIEIMRPWLTSRRDALLQVPEAAMQMSLGACFTELLRWRLDAGIAMAASLVEDLSGQRAWSLAGDFATIEAFGQLLSGRPRSALRELRTAQSMWGREEPGIYQTLALAVEQRASVLLGEHDRAHSLGRQVDALRAEGANYAPMHQVDLGIAGAWVQVVAGEYDRGIQTGWDAVQFARDGGDLMRECQALHSLARLGQRAEVAGRIAELVPRLDGPGWAAVGWHVEGLTYGGVHPLERAAERFEDVGAWLLAAEAWAEATSLHKRAGDSRQAAATRRCAHTARFRCEDARTPGLEALGAPVLTPRQREIARLAADGLTNAEIARTLTISIRTVENHLQRIYELLDIDRRTDLSEALVRSDPTG